jgi:hypothetical protein
MDYPKCIHMTAEMARQCLTCNPYPYLHEGPAVHGSKFEDYLISEANLREDMPEIFESEEQSE